ncbi:TPA: hypothetical protein ACK8SK_003104, partial [Legionella pneumophila]
SCSEYKTAKGYLMKSLNIALDLFGNKACGYDGRVLRTSLCPMGRVNKAMDNKKTLSTAIAHTHRLLAHISTRLDSNDFLTATKSLKSNIYFEATTQYIFCPSATSFIEAIGSEIMSFEAFTLYNKLL